jgi:hypothetical protein
MLAASSLTPPGHIEPLAAVLRIGGGYGEPYSWAASLRYLSPSEVEVCGAARAPKPSEWRSAIHVLQSHGISRVIFHRRSHGRVRRRQVERRRAQE